MARSTKLWRGRTDDSKAPPTVHQRVLDRDLHKCHLCQQPIIDRRWDLDHRIALINGGENVEANLSPAHKDCHRKKTGLDVAEKSKTAAMKMKDSGAKQPAGNIPARGFHRQGKERTPRPHRPPAPMFAPVNP